MSTSSGSSGARRQVPRAVVALGFVSLLMDASSEMIHALLPVYLVTAFGASMVTVGLIEGLGEATSAITKVFSGVISDRLGKRKLLAALGYGLAALTKPIFALAPSVGWIMTARFIDRLGKGIRGAPRDALIADITPPAVRGAAYGLRQALDTAGAFLGPLVAIGLMWLFADDIPKVFWVASVPALAAVLLLLIAVKDPPRPKPAATPAHRALSLAELKLLGPLYWHVVVVGALFALARFSDAFLVLKAQNAGLAMALVPLVFVGMNAVYSLAAYPIGALSDRMPRTQLLALGLLVLIGADLALAFAGGLWGVGLGVLLWGLHLGFTQGLLSALIADAAPPSLRGTAFGVFNLVSGLSLLGASVLAGALWQAMGPAATFFAGAGFAALTLIAVASLARALARAARATQSAPPKA